MISAFERVAIGVLALLAAAVWPARIAAQHPPAGDEGHARFFGAADLVVLHVSVMDTHGQYVPGLPQRAFSVSEDGVPQAITFFTSEDVPVTAGLVVDGSTSMWLVRTQVLEAIGAFAAGSHPGDEMFALSFNEHVHRALPPSAPFTANSRVLDVGLEAVMTARGKTALLDGIADGLAYVARGTDPRKVLIVISDGGDNASRTSFDAVRAAAQASDAVIYVIALIDPGDYDANPSLLHRLADETGGEMFTPRDAGEVKTLLDRIARDMRRSYTIGYTPTRPPDDTFRRVHVGVTAPDGRRLVVRTRAGYLAATASPATPSADGQDGTNDDHAAQ